MNLQTPLGQHDNSLSTYHRIMQYKIHKSKACLTEHVYYELHPIGTNNNTMLLAIKVSGAGLRDGSFRMLQHEHVKNLRRCKKFCIQIVTSLNIKKVCADHITVITIHTFNTTT